MAEHAILHEQMIGLAPAAVRVADLMLRYYDQHASELTSADSAAAHAQLWIDYWGNETVAGLTPRAQRDFIAWLEARHTRRGEPFSAGYVRRILVTGRAALNRAVDEQELTAAPKILMPSKVPPARQARKLEAQEVAALLAAAAQLSDRLMLFLMLSFNTAARPGAVLELTAEQVDLEQRRIDLNPPGRAQTRKHRPVVPITRSLLPWVVRAVGETENGHLIEYNGKPVKSLKRAFAKAVTAAGLEQAERVTPYSLRHTVATELRAAGVPELELKGFIGHSIGVTGIYAEYDPDHLAAAARAIDSYLTEVQRMVGAVCCISPLSARVVRGDAHESTCPQRASDRSAVTPSR